MKAGCDCEPGCEPGFELRGLAPRASPELALLRGLFGSVEAAELELLCVFVAFENLDAFDDVLELVFECFERERPCASTSSVVRSLDLVLGFVPLSSDDPLSPLRSSESERESEERDWDAECE